jgi:hypothetical protein
VEFEFVDGGDELGKVEVGVQLCEIFHDVLHLDVVLQFFLGQLLGAILLCEILGLGVGSGLFCPDCLLDEFVEFLV